MQFQYLPTSIYISLVWLPNPCKCWETRMVVEDFILYSLSSSIADVCNWVLYRTFTWKISIVSKCDFLHPRSCQPITSLVPHTILLFGYCSSGEKQGLPPSLQIPCNDGNATGNCSADSMGFKQFHATYTLPGNAWDVLLGWCGVGIYSHNNTVHKVCSSGYICEHPCY